MEGVAELGLTEEKQRPCLQERGKGHLHGDDGRDVGEAGVQATETGEDERLISHGLPDVTKSIGEGLELVAVAGDGEVALDDGAELGLKVDGASHLVVEEEVADECVSLESGLVLPHDDVEDFLADRAVEPRADREVLAAPLRGASSNGSVGGDVAGELVSTEKNADEHAPLGEVRGLEVEDDRDVRFHAGDVDGEGGRRGGDRHSGGEGRAGVGGEGCGGQAADGGRGLAGSCHGERRKLGLGSKVV